MNTLAYIIVYLAICAMMALFVPVAKNKWKEYFSKYYPLEIDNSKNYRLPRWIRLGISYIVLVIFTLLLFILTPFLTLDLIIRNRNRKKKRSEYTENVDTNLYFRYMGGAGTVYCCDCRFSEDIISHLHGVEVDDSGFEIETFSSGYQCQSCGKFHTLDSSEIKKVEESSKQCDCGGKLEREKPVFCPKCKSRNMKYDMEYIT